MPSNWLDSVLPCPTVYIYQSALICEGCAHRLLRYRPHRTGEDTTDPDHCPQGPYSNGGGEADAPQYCDVGAECVGRIEVLGKLKIGCPLGNPLTNEGESYTIETIARSVLSIEDSKRAAGRLWRHLYKEIKPAELLQLTSHGSPSNLGTLLDKIPPKEARIPFKMWTDLDYLYGAALSRDGVSLWRVEITPEGNFDHLKTVLLPAMEFPGRTIEDAIKEAVGSGAWD